jgi:hypothetical protein
LLDESKVVQVNRATKPEKARKGQVFLGQQRLVLVEGRTEKVGKGLKK